jgi:(p)ppGpp synthase/HD superfamily hydrolase
MEEDDTLSKVRQFAARAHQGQKRKYTRDDYIVHPDRVMRICHSVTSDVSVLCAALLHDVLEDTKVTKSEIQAFLETVITSEEASRAVSLVMDLTDVYTRENYPNLNRHKRKELERVRLSKTAAQSQTIKCADVLDNSREISEHDPDFAKVYLRECRSLLSCLEKGNEEVRHKAIETVENNLNLIKHWEDAPQHK